MDFVLLLTSIFVLWKVQLNKKTKIRLFIVFSMGSLSCVASVFRELAQKSISKDITYGYTSLLAWTVVDLTLAVVVASLPVISALIPKAWGDITHSSRGRRTTLRHTTSKATQGESVVGRVRRNTIDSEEEGILREDRIELSFARNSKQIQSTEASQTSLRKCTDQGDMSYKACLKESMDYHHALFRCKKRTGFGTELKEDELNEII
ncbi:hypothetical protein KCU68_g805, partial [Aureobasidium melanogenum]